MLLCCESGLAKLACNLQCALTSHSFWNCLNDRRPATLGDHFCLQLHITGPKPPILLPVLVRCHIYMCGQQWPPSFKWHAYSLANSCC
jgi:hypothetical protein